MINYGKCLGCGKTHRLGHYSFDPDATWEEISPILNKASEDWQKNHECGKPCYGWQVLED